MFIATLIGQVFPMTRRSVTSYLVKLGNAPVSWKTKKQITVSRSSVKAEYRDMANATSETVWIMSFDLHVPTTNLYYDNQAITYC